MTTNCRLQLDGDLHDRPRGRRRRCGPACRRRWPCRGPGRPRSMPRKRWKLRRTSSAVPSGVASVPSARIADSGSAGPGGRAGLPASARGDSGRGRCPRWRGSSRCWRQRRAISAIASSCSNDWTQRPGEAGAHELRQTLGERHEDLLLLVTVWVVGGYGRSGRGRISPGRGFAGDTRPPTRRSGSGTRASRRGRPAPGRAGDRPRGRRAGRPRAAAVRAGRATELRSASWSSPGGTIVTEDGPGHDPERSIDLAGVGRVPEAGLFLDRDAQLLAERRGDGLDQRELASLLAGVRTSCVSSKGKREDVEVSATA